MASVIDFLKRLIADDADDEKVDVSRRNAIVLGAAAIAGGATLAIPSIAAPAASPVADPDFRKRWHQLVQKFIDDNYSHVVAWTMDAKELTEEDERFLNKFVRVLTPAQATFLWARSTMDGVNRLEKAKSMHRAMSRTILSIYLIGKCSRSCIEGGCTREAFTEEQYFAVDDKFTAQTGRVGMTEIERLELKRSFARHRENPCECMKERT